MSPGTCETCRHWIARPDADQGVCDKIEGIDGCIGLDMRPDALAEAQASYEHTAVALVTKAQFGCVLHEPQPTLKPQADQLTD